MYDESGPLTENADTVPRSHRAWLSKSNEGDKAAAFKSQVKTSEFTTTDFNVESIRTTRLKGNSVS
jgi:hypothetical protein